VTVPALAFCCLYASGILHTMAPKSWHPPQDSPAKLAELAQQASLTWLGRPPGSSRFFGVAIPANALHEWFSGPPKGGKSYEGTHVHPQLLMDFQSWGATKKQDRMPTHQLREDEKVGIVAEMFTWQPWQPPTIGLSPTRQENAQQQYSNQAIIDGMQDPYIRRWADALKEFPGITVYIRFGHEMNGTWYPWSLDPQEYVLAWRHIWNIFQQQHVRNAKFVWSADFGEGPPDPSWQNNLMAYWPGKQYVNDIGTTMVNFGGEDSHSVSQFTPRIELVHQLFNMPVMLTEVNTDKQGRSRWMLDLAKFVEQTSWINGVVWSQQPSYGAGNMTTGDMKWQIWTDKSRRARQAFSLLASAAKGDGT
jgi:Glycosyl hydrolase family 26